MSLVLTCLLLTLSCLLLHFHTLTHCSPVQWLFFYDSAVTWGHFCWHSHWRRPVESINQIDWQLRSCRELSEKKFRSGKNFGQKLAYIIPLSQSNSMKLFPSLVCRKWRGGREGGWVTPCNKFSCGATFAICEICIEMFLRLTQWREFMQIFMAQKIVAWSGREREKERDSEWKRER